MALRTLIPTFQDSVLPCFIFLPQSSPGLAGESKVAWGTSYSYFVGVYVAVGSNKGLPVSSAHIVLPLEISFPHCILLPLSGECHRIPVFECQVCLLLLVTSFLGNDVYTCTLCM